MTTTVFQTQAFQAPATPTVGVAFRQLFAALFAPVQRSAAAGSPEEEANAVRELAAQYMATDPGFAEDLYAAADRHELAHIAATQGRATLQ